MDLKLFYDALDEVINDVQLAEANKPKANRELTEEQLARYERLKPEIEREVDAVFAKYGLKVFKNEVILPGQQCEFNSKLAHCKKREEHLDKREQHLNARAAGIVEPFVGEVATAAWVNEFIQDK